MGQVFSQDFFRRRVFPVLILLANLLSVLNILILSLSGIRFTQLQLVSVFARLDLTLS